MAIDFMEKFNLFNLKFLTPQGSIEIHGNNIEIFGQKI